MDKKISTLEKLLDSANTLIAMQGYDGTSVQEICDHAGVSKGAFYHHFSTKQSLFVNLMDVWSEQTKRMLATTPLESDTMPATLLEMVNRSEAAFQAAPQGFPILIEFWRQARLEPEIWEKAIGPYHTFLRLFEGMVAKGIHEGSLTEMDVNAGAHLLMAFAMGYLLQVAIDPNGEDWKTLGTEGMRLILDGIRREEQ